MVEDKLFSRFLSFHSALRHVIHWTDVECLILIKIKKDELAELETFVFLWIKTSSNDA